MIRSRLLGLTLLCALLVPGIAPAQFLENLALDKPATQSSTLGGFRAGLAVDGQRGNFSSTLQNAELPDPAWWEVDLQDTFDIGQVVLWNRSNFLGGGSRLRDIIVEIRADDGTIAFRTTDPANPDPAELLNPENVLGAFPNGPANITVDFGEEPVEGRVVRVYRIPDEDLSGTDGQGTVLEATTLSLSEVEVFASGGAECPEEGDTHCEGLDIVPPLGGDIVGGWFVSVDATDDSFDLITYSFTATHEGGTVLRASGAAPSTTFNLSIPGEWTISVTVDDDPFCADVADDATCEELVEVEALPGLTDANGFILTKAFLVLGPFSHSFGCGPAAEGNILRNHIANARIECEYPREGDSIDYDAIEAASNAYIGPEADGVPTWRAFDDGTLENGDQDLNGDIGQRNDVMSWIVTYVEYTGNAPTDIQICMGSDDGGQVYWNDQRVISDPACRGRGDCDVRSELIQVERGVHRIAAAAWNRGGGWGLRLSLEDGTFFKIVDDGALFPEWVFHGRTPPDGYEPPECGPQGCQPEPVRNLVCEVDAAGLTLQWENPPITDPDIPTRIEVEDGFGLVTEVESVASDETMVTIPTADLPPEFNIVRVIHCGGVPASCGPFKTDSTGGILSENYLILGPFEHPFKCNGPTANLRRNHIAPSEIGCLYPEAGDEVPYDPELSASTGYVGPRGDNGMPVVRRFSDGSPRNSDHNLNGDLGQLNDVMSWLMTYVEYAGEEPTTLEICFGSGDGGQLWVNDQELFTTSKCRARADCQDQVMVELDGPAILRIAAGAWNAGGSWGLTLRLGQNGAPVVDSIDNDDWIFHGTRKPEDFVSPCGGPGLVRGDSNADADINITDGIFVLNFLFTGGPGPTCSDAADANDDGQVNISDGVWILNFLFTGGEPPPAPLGECGDDPTDDDLDCVSFPPCA